MAFTDSAAGRLLALTKFAARHRGIRDAVLTIAVNDADIHVIEESALLGGLGLPLSYLLSLLTNTSGQVDRQDEAGMLLLPGGLVCVPEGETASADSLASRQRHLLTQDRNVARSVLRLVRLIAPTEAWLAATLIDQLVADADADLHPAQAPQNLTTELTQVVARCERQWDTGECGWLMFQAALQHHSVLRHLGPTALRTPRSAQWLATTGTWRQLPPDLPAIVEVLTEAAAGSSTARQRMLSHLVTTGRTEQSAATFLAAVYRRLEPVARRMSDDLARIDSPAAEPAPALIDPLATAVVLGQVVYLGTQLGR